MVRKVLNFKKETTHFSNKGKVALVSMPWASVLEPSLGLAIISESLKKKNIQTKIFHLNLDLLKYLKYSTYSSLSEIFAINESLFLKSASGEYSDAEKIIIKKAIKSYYHRWSDSRSVEEIFETTILLQKDIFPKYIKDCSLKIKEFNPSIVGFTCMFDQIGSSLALAKELKSLTDVTIVFGGYAVSGKAANELRKIPFVDYVFEGEGEENFSSFCDYIFNKKFKLAFEISKTPYQANMEISPTPIFHDYFYDIQKIYEDHKIKIMPEYLPIDSSRGCWWGQKHHCSFCGIRSEEMNYRYKSPERFLHQLKKINSIHKFHNFRISDYILPRKYLSDEVSEMLHNTGFTFSSEMKANISEKDADNIYKAGFSEIQIGVESFSTNTLKKINKGISGIENIRSIKILSSKKISVIYNIIYGFEFEGDIDYQFYIDNLCKLYHLPPPTSFTELAITADSPLSKNLKKEKKLIPHENYEVLFPKNKEWSRNIDFSHIAYIFKKPYSFDKTKIKIISDLIKSWKIARDRRACLEVRKEKNNFLLIDSRTNYSELKLNNNHLNFIDFVGNKVFLAEKVIIEFSDEFYFFKKNNCLLEEDGKYLNLIF